MVVENLMNLEETTKESYTTFVSTSQLKSYIMSASLSQSTHYIITDHYGWDMGSHIVYSRWKRSVDNTTGDIVEEKFFLRKD